MFIKLFSEISKTDVLTAGGKGASLGEMTRGGIPVPPGFVILTEAFEQFLRETDLNVEIEAILHTVDTEKMHTIEEASGKIQHLILHCDVPSDIAREILKNFEVLGAQYVAVRSSATAEDSASAAWAGQLDSYLNTTEATLLQNVRKCFSSLFTPRAIFYRFEKGLHQSKIGVAVVVQKMVESEVSGIAFSVHPVTEDHNQLIIEAGYGLGEAIVSGQITPDSYVIEKEPRLIIDKNIAIQTRALYRKDGGEGSNEWRDIPEPKASAQVLNETQILELSELILRIERHYGFPCDIEWAFENENFYIVQSRPITTLSTKVPTLKLYEQLGRLEIWNKAQWYEQGRWAQLPFVYTFYSHQSRTEVAARILGLSFQTSFSIEGYFFLSIADGEKIKAYIKKGYQEETLGALTERLDSEGTAITKKVLDILEKDDEYLREHIADFVNLYTEFAAFWCVAVFIGDQVTSASKEIGYAASDGELFEKVHSHLRKTWIENEMEDMKCMALILVKNPEENVTAALRAYVEKYKWMRMVKWQGEPLTLKEARQRLTEEVENHKQGNYIEFHHTKGNPDDMVRLGVATACWRAECGGVEMKAAFRLRPIFAALGKELGVGYEQVLLLAPQELVATMEGSSTAPAFSEVLQREKGFFSTVDDDGNEIIISHSDPEYQKLHNLYVHFDESNSSDTLMGVGASGGKARGKVRVVNSMQESGKFEEGDILVAPETTPSFVPLMRKAAAILTGKGGITSHAAIVSRELKKPCIIAIKNVARILKTGDLVEVDADSGVVRIIERARPTSLSKIYSREKSLFYLNIWDESDRAGTTKYLGVSIENNLFILKPDGAAEVWYDTEQLQAFSTLALKKLGDEPELVHEISAQLESSWHNLAEYFEGDKKIQNFPEVKKYYQDIVEFWSAMNSVFFELPEKPGVPREFSEVLLRMRKKTQEYTNQMSENFVRFFEDSYPELSRFSRVVTLFEAEQLAVLGNASLIAILEERIQHGCCLFQNQVRPLSELDGILEKHQLVCESEGAENTLGQNVPKRPVYEKIFSRDFCLPIVETWCRAESTDSRVWTEKQQPEVPYIIFQNESGLVSCYMDHAGIAWVKQELARLVEADPSFVDFAADTFVESVKPLRRVWKKEEISDLTELRTYLKNLRFAWGWFEAVWWLMELFHEDETELAKLISARVATEKIGDASDALVRKVLRKFFPSLGDGAEYLLIEEIENEILPSREELKRRKQRYIYTNAQLFVGDAISNIEHQFGITINTVSADAFREKSHVSGRSAYEGVVQGRVRVIFSQKDISQMKEGEILVSPMTTPDFVPAMNKAAAFVTDEGGVMCHAAIIAREMKKPCIIGTKIATKVLHDGDMVEVDADNGVVRILSDDTLNKEDYVHTFTTEGVPLLFQYLSAKYYNPPRSLSICPNAGVRTYIHRESVRQMRRDGQDFFSDEAKVKAVAKQAISLLDEIETLAETCAKRGSISKQQVDALLRLFGNLAKQYSFFEAINTEGAYAAYGGMNKGLEIAEKSKNVIREGINFTFFDKGGGYEKFLVEVSRINGDSPDCVAWYSEEEVRLAMKKERVPRQVIEERKELCVLYKDEHEKIMLWTGERARVVQGKFEQRLGREKKEWRGVTAHGAGKVMGTVSIINSDYTHLQETKEKMRAMPEGNILVSVTTAPDLLLAMQKAGAIITDLGGMLSHAAITARELDKPCIVGVGDASKILKDGDLVEVDADNGVVRVIKRKV